MRRSTLAVMVALGLLLSACGRAAGDAAAPSEAAVSAVPFEPPPAEAPAGATAVARDEEERVEEDAAAEDIAWRQAQASSLPPAEDKPRADGWKDEHRAAHAANLAPSAVGGLAGLDDDQGAAPVTRSAESAANRKKRAEAPKPQGASTPAQGPAGSHAPADALALAHEAEPAAKEARFDDAEGGAGEGRRDEAGWFDQAALADRFVAPARTLPRMFYFENTYLGGNAGYVHRMRRLEGAFPDAAPFRLAHAAPQAFDPPGAAGMALTATSSQRWVDRPQRVMLQIGLQGSDRFGWRRPPLDMVVVVDDAARAEHPDVLIEVTRALVAHLGPQDRVGLVLAGAEPRVVRGVDRVRSLQTELSALLADESGRPRGAGDLEAALRRAGDHLARAQTEPAVVPGTQSVVLVTAGQDEARVGAAVRATHALTLQGAVTSVVQLGATDRPDPWWRVADAGHGNYHVAAAGQLAAPIGAEVESLSRVVARLLRLNVRLAKGVKAIRVLGSRMLDADEVARVKAREEAVDLQLSRALGVTADRGEDDDGIQTVIPYFLGGDDHVVLIELWVERPGPVADVTLKYKDMVALTNATARASVALAATPRPDTVEQRMVLRNVASFRVAEALAAAARHARRGDPAESRATLARAARDAVDADRAMLSAFQAALVDAGPYAPGAPLGALTEALELAALRKLGQPAPR